MCSLLSSLFSLFSSFAPEDAERARPWRLHMRDGLLRRNHDPPLTSRDSSSRTNLVSQVLLFKIAYLRISGCFFGDLFSFLSSRFSAAAHFSECPSLFSLRSLHQAIDFAPNRPSDFVSGHRLRSQQPRCLAVPFWDRTIAFCGPLILIVIVSLFSLLFALFRHLS